MRTETINGVHTKLGPQHAKLMEKTEAASVSPSTKTGWRAILPIHPAAELFPLMDEAELRELADDIAKHGLKEKVDLYDDPEIGHCVLDGRNRLDAFALLGKGIFDASGYPVREQRWVGDEPSFDPYSHVISKNILRRDLHLTAEQRRALIAKVLMANPDKSNRQIAKQVKADDKTVAKVRTKLEARSEIPNVETAIDTKGRKQPVRKQRSSLDRYKPGSADERKAQSPDEQAAKEARALAEFTFACRTWLPQINLEANRQKARLLVSELTGVKPQARVA
jgi:hypothetical protein